jgi:hypothetical protein
LLVTNSSIIPNRDWKKQFATRQLVKSFAPTRRRIPPRKKESRSSSQRNFRKWVT